MGWGQTGQAATLCRSVAFLRDQTHSRVRCPYASRRTRRQFSFGGSMRGLCLAMMLVVATSCGGSDLAAPTNGSPSDSAHVVPEVPTNTVVVSFLSAGVTDTTLLEGK